MVLSLQAIDFLLASSIQDGWPLSDMDCSVDGSVGDDEGDEDGPKFLRDHLSSRGLSGTLVGLDSERRKLCHVAAHGDTEYQLSISTILIHNSCESTHLQYSLLAFPPALCLCLQVWFSLRWRIHLMSVFLFEFSSCPPEKNSLS